MPAPLTLYLIRHGEVFNPEKVHYGRLPNFRLSDTGRNQASSAGHYLKDRPIAAIYSSPMQRAQETAGLVAAELPHSLTVQTDDHLNEVLSPFDGTSQAELDLIFFDLYTGTQPPYEQPRDLRHRLVTFINGVRRHHPNQEVVAVTHGDIVVTAFMFAKHQSENDIGRTRFDVERTRLMQLGLPDPYPVTASISRLEFRSDDTEEIPHYTYIKPY